MQKVSKARTIDIFSKQHVFLNLYIFIQREDKYWNKIRKKKLEDLKVRVLFGFFLKIVYCQNIHYSVFRSMEAIFCFPIENVICIIN